MKKHGWYQDFPEGELSSQTERSTRTPDKSSGCLKGGERKILARFVSPRNVWGFIEEIMKTWEVFVFIEVNVKLVYI